MAVVAGFDLGVGDGLLAALGSLFKGDGNVRLDIAATAGRIGIGPAAAAAKTAEEAVKDIGEIKAALEGVPTAGAAAKVGVHPRMAKLIIPGTFLLVGKHLVCLVDLFEFCLCFLIPGVQVRVVFLCQLPVSLFQLVVGGPFGHPQHLVIIPFIRHDPSLPSSGSTPLFSQALSPGPRPLHQRCRDSPLPPHLFHEKAAMA